MHNCDVLSHWNITSTLKKMLYEMLYLSNHILWDKSTITYVLTLHRLIHNPYRFEASSLNPEAVTQICVNADGNTVASKVGWRSERRLQASSAWHCDVEWLLTTTNDLQCIGSMAHCQHIDDWRLYNVSLSSLSLHLPVRPVMRRAE